MPLSRLLVNEPAPVPAAPPPPGVRRLHRRLPGAAPTPLLDLPELAAAAGVGRVLVKAEVERMGLPSFKVLGASWATYRLLCERLQAAGVLAGTEAAGGESAGELPGTPGSGPGTGPGSGFGRGGEGLPDVPPEPVWSTVDELADLIAEHLGPLRLVAATDGNHGRAVAWMARQCRLAATILVPEGTAAARMHAIADEGAEVLVVAGTYDDAVRASAAFAAGDDTTRHAALAIVENPSLAGGPGRPSAAGGPEHEALPAGAETRLVVSDTSWAGYEEVPRWVIEGYSTIFAELAEQLAAHGVSQPDVVVVPLGVGALGAAAAVALRAGVAPGEGPLLVGVEPTSAACVAAAVEAGEVVELPGPHRSIMAGLNCGLASPVALPLVSAGFGALVAVDDGRARAALRALAGQGLDVGETGAAALAGLTALAGEHRAAVPLASDAVVVLLATEGVTDPVNFERIVGRPPGPQRAATR